MTEDPLGGEQRKVGKMLVVYRVKLVVLDQSQQMRKFHGDDAVPLQEDPQSRDKVVQVGNVGENIVTDYQVGAFPLRGKLLGATSSEKIRKRGNAGGDCDVCHIAGTLRACQWRSR